MQRGTRAAREVTGARASARLHSSGYEHTWPAVKVPIMTQRAKRPCKRRRHRLLLGARPRVASTLCQGGVEDVLRFRDRGKCTANALCEGRVAQSHTRARRASACLRAELHEAGLGGDVAEARQHAARAAGAGLVNLGEQRVGRVRDDGGDHACARAAHESRLRASHA
eukprot:6214236-Pleurochrysis_carterae.AAC.2